MKALCVLLILFFATNIFAKNYGYEKRIAVIQKLNSYGDMSFVPMWSNNTAFAYFSPAGNVILIFYKHKEDSDFSYSEKSGSVSAVFLVSGIVGISHSMRGMKISERIKIILTGEAGQ